MTLVPLSDRQISYCWLSWSQKGGLEVEWTFSVTASKLWKELPLHIRQAYSLPTFKFSLKTHFNTFLGFLLLIIFTLWNDFIFILNRTFYMLCISVLHIVYNTLPTGAVFKALYSYSVLYWILVSFFKHYIPVWTSGRFNAQSNIEARLLSTPHPIHTLTLKGCGRGELVKLMATKKKTKLKNHVWLCRQCTIGVLQSSINSMWTAICSVWAQKNSCSLIELQWTVMSENLALWLKNTEVVCQGIYIWMHTKIVVFIFNLFSKWWISEAGRIATDIFVHLLHVWHVCEIFKDLTFGFVSDTCSEF